MVYTLTVPLRAPGLLRLEALDPGTRRSRTSIGSALPGAAAAAGEGA